MMFKLAPAFSALFLLAVLAACSGGGSDGSALLNPADPGASISTLSISGPGTVPAGGSGSYTLKLVGGDGKAVMSTPVTLTSSLGVISLATSTASLTTDINGEVAFILTAVTVTNISATTMPVSGSAVLSASAVISDTKVSGTKTVQFTPTVFDFASPAADSKLQANVRQTLQFEWTSDGLAVNSPVTFATDTGVLIDDAGNSAANLSVTTVNGLASIDLLVSSSGAVNVTASSGTSAGDLSAVLPLSFVATAASLSVTAATPITSTGSSIVSVVVKDAGGDPLPGLTVSFALTSSPGGSLAILSATTDSTGMASTVYDADGASGTASVQVTVVPLAPVTKTITIT